MKFTLDEDIDTVLNESPWVIQDHYLTVRRWNPEFDPSIATIDSTIASCIGKPIKIDSNTAFATRGRFARVCVEVDLTKALVGQFWLNNRWHCVEYESLHNICFECGKFGHITDSCPLRKNKEQQAA